MSNNTITGNEPAMPVSENIGLNGLTIRQHFTAMAMQSYLVATHTRRETLISRIKRLFGFNYKAEHDFNLEALSKASVQAADALIAELNKESEVDNG